MTGPLRRLGRDAADGIAVVAVGLAAATARSLRTVAAALTPDRAVVPDVVPDGLDVPSATAVTHVAGPELVWHGAGPLLRQRCAWCGTVLVDLDLSTLQVPDGADPGPGGWELLAQVRVDGNVSYLVEADPSDENPDATRPPDDACIRHR